MQVQSELHRPLGLCWSVARNLGSRLRPPKWLNEHDTTLASSRTDNCHSGISGRERMTTKCISLDTMFTWTKIMSIDLSQMYHINTPTNHSHAKPQSIQNVHKRSFRFSMRGVINAHLLQNLANYFL